jgi:hypothetical protein
MAGADPRSVSVERGRVVAGHPYVGETVKCGRCGWPILWATTDHGKRIALDPDPVPTRRGFRVEGPAGARRAVHTFSRTRKRRLHEPHVALCPPFPPPLGPSDLTAPEP